MGAWDLHVPAIQGVLTKTQGVAKGFEAEMTSLQTSMQNGTQATQSQIIATAMSTFADKIKPLEFVVKRTGDAMTGAVNAVNAYVKGDLEMAANAQKAASSATVPPAWEKK
ncbi:DUF6507 family protein [Fodinicola feengrottensis]|uniref:DUF6507 family protein n=1 Tax=Fodinicola feengrottensis TaxID=435914 RepID=UPI0013D44875|nr:DUF6507 family protein [Fodinicola feengrottensis]